MKKLVFIVIGLCVVTLAGVWLINWYYGRQIAAVQREYFDSSGVVLSAGEPLPAFEIPKKPKPAPEPEPDPKAAAEAAAKKAEEMKKREAFVKDAVAKADRYITLPEYSEPVDHLSLVANILGQPLASLSYAPAFYGTWPEGGTSADRIEWVIALRPTPDMACMVSKRVIECKPFDDGAGGKAGWSGSSLRKWLNGEFYEKAFSDKEKERIITANVVDRSGGKKVTVKDRVFILCEDELPVYLRRGEELMTCEPSRYVRGAFPGAVSENGSVSWWTRGREGAGFACVTADGKTGKPDSAGDETIGVRPVIWMKAN